MDSNLQFRDGMSTKEIQKILIRTAIEKTLQTVRDEHGNVTKKTNSNWQYVAARLLMADLYKEAAIQRGYHHFGYGDFYELVEFLTKEGYYGSYMMEDRITSYNVCYTKLLRLLLYLYHADTCLNYTRSTR